MAAGLEMTTHAVHNPQPFSARYCCHIECSTAMPCCDANYRANKNDYIAKFIDNVKHKQNWQRRKKER
eukprot:5889037-Amphidinium_carterae.1